MQRNKIWFTSIIGFFYQYGIGCDVDENKAFEMYLLTVNNEESLFQFTNSNLLGENEEEFEILQNNNIIIGKYLLSLFYYKDIILSGYVINLNFAKKGDSRAQCNL